jgi:hypothetical protein
MDFNKISKIEARGFQDDHSRSDVASVAGSSEGNASVSLLREAEFIEEREV